MKKATSKPQEQEKPRKDVVIEVPCLNLEIKPKRET